MGLPWSRAHYLPESNGNTSKDICTILGGNKSAPFFIIIWLRHQVIAKSAEYKYILVIFRRRARMTRRNSKSVGQCPLHKWMMEQIGGSDGLLNEVVWMSQRKDRINMIASIREFLWPTNVFRDASKGNLFERAAAYRHNRQARGCLPHYMRNCLLVAVLLAGAGVCLEQGHNLTSSILCWILVTYSITELAVLSAIYLALTAWES